MVMWLFLTDNRVFSFCFFFLFFSFLFFFFSFFWFFVSFSCIFSFSWKWWNLSDLFFNSVFRVCHCEKWKRKISQKKPKKKKMAKCWERNEENDDQQTEREKNNHWMGSKSIRIRWLWFPSTQVDLWPALQRPHAAEAKLCFIKNKRKTAIRNTVESQRRFSTAFPAFALFDFVSTRSLLFSQNKPKKNKTKQNKTKKNETEPDRISTSGIHLINNSFIKTKQKNQKKTQKKK